jgi:Uma2 family endonuclease
VSASQISQYASVADVLSWVGKVPLHRVRCDPPPGYSTREALDSLNSEGIGRYELIASVVVERAGSREQNHLRDRIASLLTLVIPQDGSARIAINHPFQLDRYLVRLPDIALVETRASCVPALVAEVLHLDHTAREIALKLAECERYGVKLVWYVDPKRKEVDVYPKGNPKRKKTLGVNDTLDGGDVLPGFAVKVARLFESRAPAKKGGKKSKK